MKCSLIIPCYNEAANIPLLLERCKGWTIENNVEVILVDNGSADNSAEVLKNLLPSYPGCRGVRVEKNQGYGFGIVSGLKAADGDILAWTHADMQTDPKDIIEGLRLFKKQGLGTFVKGLRYGRPFSDTVFTVGMSIFETILLGKKLNDINAQPTIFHRSFFETWQDPPNDFSLDLYAYYNARTHKPELTVKRFPVKFGERAHGTSHWNVNWAAKWKFIKRTVDFSLHLKRNISK